MTRANGYHAEPISPDGISIEVAERADLGLSDTRVGSRDGLVTEVTRVTAPATDDPRSFAGGRDLAIP